MNVDVLEVLKFMIDSYGLAGFALLFWVWQGWQLQKKIDHLQNTTNKMFGVILALADKRSRDFNGGGSEND